MRYMLVLGFDAVELTSIQLDRLLTAQLIERAPQKSRYFDELMFVPKGGVDPTQVELMTAGGNA